jgi:type IV secretion system protein VirB1
MELMGCQDLAVPNEVMHHVVRVESAFNPYAIGVVGGRLVRQPRNVSEAVATARDLEARGYNFSLGLAQVNRHNLTKYGLSSYENAFQACPNLQAGARILAECHGRAGGDWGKSFSCYYSGNFVTGFRHGYVQKVMASMQGAGPAPAPDGHAIAMAGPKQVKDSGTVSRRRLPMLQPQDGHMHGVPRAPRATRTSENDDSPPVVLAAASSAAAVALPLHGRPPSDSPLLADDPTLPPPDGAFVF